MAKAKVKKESQKSARTVSNLAVEPKFNEAIKQIASITGVTVKAETEQALAFHYLEKYHEITKLLDSLKNNSEEVQNSEGYQLWKSQLIVLKAAYSVFANHVDDIVDQMTAQKKKGSFIIQTSLEGKGQ